MDRRPECVYALLVRDQRVFLSWHKGTLGLPGGVFQPLAEDRKVELRAYLADQLGIVSSVIWAQGAFDYQHPAESEPRFSGFYTVWEWANEIEPAAGTWLTADDLPETELPAPLKILLLSVLNTQAVKTT
ncbi:MAG: hypothetical protein ABI782_05875 [Anaerolineaceae bacterium]